MDVIRSDVGILLSKFKTVRSKFEQYVIQFVFRSSATNIIPLYRSSSTLVTNQNALQYPPATNTIRNIRNAISTTRT